MVYDTIHACRHCGTMSSSNAMVSACESQAVTEPKFKLLQTVYHSTDYWQIPHTVKARAMRAGVRSYPEAPQLWRVADDAHQWVYDLSPGEPSMPWFSEADLRAEPRR